MSIQDIQAIYDKVYSSKYNDLVKNKQNSLNGLSTQETGVNNQYQALFNDLGNRRKQAAGEYQTQQNQAAVSNARNVAGIRDWMAKNNLLQSGENVDAILRSNTDYGNEKGRIKNAESQYYTQLDTQRANSEREKAQKISDILAKRNQIENSFIGDVQAAKDQLEAQKLRDILALRDQEKQRQLASARARSSYSKGDSLGSRYTASDKEGVRNQFAQMMQDPNANVYQWLTQNKGALVNVLGETEYNRMRGLYNNVNAANARISAKTAALNYAAAGAPTRTPTIIAY